MRWWGIKGGNFIGLNYSIIGDVKLWNKMGSPDLKYDDVRVENSYGYPEGFLVLLVGGVTIVKIELRWFFLLIVTNFEKSLVLK